VRDALINNELPLTSNNIYSEIQGSLLRPIYVSSLMANDTFLKDWMLDGERDVAQITKYLNEIRNKYQVFSTFLVSDLSRNYYHYNGVLKQVSPEVPKDAWFFSMPEHPANYRVDVDTNEAERNKLTIFINHKVYDYNGRFIGVTGLGLDAVNVSELIQRYKQDYARNIYFVDRNGLVKSHEDDRIIDKMDIRQRAGIAAVANELLTREQGFLKYDLDGDTILLSFRFIPELDWYLIVEQPESEALRPIRQALWANLAISVIITALVLVISGYTANRFQHRLEVMAKTDKLTGLVNRQYFDLLFENAVNNAARRDEPLSIIVFDIDHFKPINDRYGHLVGDRLLRAVADAARGGIREADIISRWGGDEFIILLMDCDEADAAQLAEALRRRVRVVVEVPESGEAVTISAGVAQYRAGDSYESLLDRADQRLYAAKQGGRDRTVAAD
jgi:diguanylate cyclase (GGDEF)-like protein